MMSDQLLGQVNVIITSCQEFQTDLTCIDNFAFNQTAASYYTWHLTKYLRTYYVNETRVEVDFFTLTGTLQLNCNNKKRQKYEKYEERK